MPAKAQQFVPKGMKRDYSPSKADPQFAFENHNIRVTPMEGSTLLSVTNERGTAPAKFSVDPYNKITVISSYDPASDSTTISAKAARITPDVSVTIDIDYIDPDGYSNSDQIYLKNGSGVWEAGGRCTFVKATVTDSTVRSKDSIFWINLQDRVDYPIFPGTYLGHCIINNFIVLFFHEGPSDYIIRLENINGTFKYKLLYEGNLNLDSKAPIETIGVYENDIIQKVYWIDGINQPRVINILGQFNFWSDTTIFDFAPDIPENTSLGVTQEQGGSGMFSPGTIQYAVTFYRKYGQETGICKISPLYYISFKDRAAAPDEVVNTTFTVTVSYASNYQSYDYARIYSIHRTSLDATPTVKVVGDLSINGEVGTGQILDTGTIGYTVDPSMLLYLGSTQITAKTFEQKDNTLFLGGYSIIEQPLTTELKKKIKDNSTISFRYSSRDILPVGTNDFYPYKNQLGLSEEVITCLKSREWYRFGVQLQYPTGKWSDVVWTDDRRCPLAPKHTLDSAGDKVELAYGVVTLSEEVTTELAKSFIAVRGVIVFPTISEREVVYQGVLCPTVYNVRDRASNSPFVQSSWFFRETPKGTDSGPFPSEDRSEIESGVEMRHNSSLKAGLKMVGSEVAYLASSGGEIQGLWAPGYNPPNPYYSVSNTMARDYPNAFFVDQSTLTFHSPDIEFEEDRGVVQGSDLRLRIIGTVPLGRGSMFSTVDMQNLGMNGYPSSTNFIQYYSLFRGGRLTTTLPKWRDTIAGRKDARDDIKFLVYPWHRKGSLNNFPTPNEGETRPAVIKSKVFSNLRVSRYSRYWAAEDLWVWDANGMPIQDDDMGYKNDRDEPETYTGITKVQIFDSNEVTMLRLEEPANSGLDLGGINYYGNIDTVFTGFGVYEAGGLKATSYPISLLVEDSSVYRKEYLVFLNSIQNVSEFGELVVPERYQYGSDPIPMAYKSTPHAVFSLNYNIYRQQRVLPVIGKDPSINPIVGKKGDKPFWSDKTADADSLVSYENLSDYRLSGSGDPYLYLAELYRIVTPDSIFGGRSEDALENNKWLVAGEPIKLQSGTITEVPYTYGDTYYQRYDCLKTYPFGNGAVNNIVEIVSFMCETRINIDGRYDRNRGQSNNVAMTPLNFNLFNPVYSQKNNFFTYNLINSEGFSNQNFRNSITWTKTKSFAEEIDAWTHITLASTLDLDGDKGEVEALRRFNNELYCFQPLGISRILYNSRAQMATLGEGAAAMPVELANTGKVDGKVYMTNGVGSSNKWSIVTTPSGMYFIDDLTNSIQLLGTGGLSDLSDKLAFREWVNRVSSLEKWTPEESSEGFKNVVTYYDSTNSDVYFITNSPDTTVVYSELVGQFSSFYDYEKVPLMFSMGGKFFSLKKNKLWEQNAGEYNLFFGVRKPYSVEVICNIDEPIDKIFNTVEWRATIKDIEGNDSTSTFDTVRVTTDGEYQDTGEVPIINKTNNSSGGMITSSSTSLRRMFRMWRIPIPRDQRNKRDRMRGPWAKIKLSKKNPGNERMELHDMMVHFFE